MNIVFAGINAKYSHTNLAIRILRKFAQQHSIEVQKQGLTVLAREWNINIPHGTIVRGLIETQPSIIFFSVYVWNRETLFRVADDVRKVLPETVIVLGGPEVSWSVEPSFRDCPSADIIVSGEGELSVCDVIDRYYQRLPGVGIEAFTGLPGVTVRDRQAGTVFLPPPRDVIADLDSIPFPYEEEDMDFNPEHRIVYYESSRGCPFSCAYCLSAIDKSVRYYSLERVLREIGYFMKAGFPLIKFVDRTFNLDPARYLAIWRYIRDHHNGKTLFHFEIAAEYLSDDAMELLDTIPQGAIQFEIGIQSINPETLQIVGRPAHPAKLAEKIRRIPRNIHVHIDLIAGLPAENFESFIRSFNYAFDLKADMLQLGFLKILSGSPMDSLVRREAGFVWSSTPPYEILSTPVLSYTELLVLKDVEQVVDTWFNSGLMRNTLISLAGESTSGNAFVLFCELASFIRKYFSDGDLYLPRRPSDCFACLADFMKGGSLEYLRYDYLLQGKPGTFPAWFIRRYDKVAHDKALEMRGLVGEAGMSRRSAYSRTEYEVFEFSKVEKTAILFQYSDQSGKEKKATCIRL